MINENKDLKLVNIYSIIFDRIEKELRYKCGRFNNN